MAAGAGLALLARRTSSASDGHRRSKPWRTQPPPAPDRGLEGTDQLRLLLDSAKKYAIFALSPEGKFLTWNKGAESVFGYSEPEILGQDFEILFTPEDRAAGVPQAQLRQAHGGQCVSEERWYLSKDRKRFFLSGRLCPMRDRLGQMAGFASVGRDITDRILQEESLRHRGDVAQALLQSEKRFRKLIENGSDVIALLDTQGNILYKSPSVRRLGFNPDELTGLSVLEQTHPDDRAKVASWLEELRRHPEESVQGEFRHLHRDGSYRWMEGVASNMLGDPAVRAIVSNFRDITERKRAEAELQEARDRLRQHAQALEQRVAERTAQLQESVRSLEGILYHVTHDLRAPLRAVQGHATMLARRCGSPSDPLVHQHETQISAAITRMDDLIRGLLGYGRLGYLELPLQNVSLQTRLAHILGRLTEDIRAKDAEVIVADALPPVWAHPGTLDQILTNLIENALKFVLPGVPPRIRIDAETHGDRVRISVQDNGIGIPPEYHERIFRVFERLHESDAYPGTGIGLAIVRKAAERMGGTVGVESAPGAGSRFWVDLPAARLEP